MTSIFLFSSSSIVGTNIYCEFKYARHWTEKLTHFISWNHLNYFLMWSDYSPLCIIKNTESKGNSIPSVQFSAALSCVWLCVTPWIAACQASLSITNSRSLFKLTSIELVMPSNHLILCLRLLLPPSIFPSIRVFSRVSSLHQVAKLFLFYFFTFFSTLSF